MAKEVVKNVKRYVVTDEYHDICSGIMNPSEFTEYKKSSMCESEIVYEFQLVKKFKVKELRTIKLIEVGLEEKIVPEDEEDDW